MEENFMKKFVVVLAIIALVATSVWAGGKSDKGSKGSGGGAEPFIVDLSTLPLVKNASPFTKGYDDLLINLPKSSLPSDFSKYTRVTITAIYFNSAGDELPQADSMCMVSMIYDLDGDIRGPAMGPGPNTPVKEFNVGGFSGLTHSDKGIRVTFKQPPQAILLQNNGGSPAMFIELTGLIFHNGDYSSK
jgi:hypothetical protein